MKRFLLFLLLPISAFAQQGAFIPPRTVFGTVNGITRPIAGATVTVCGPNASGTPCSPALVNTVFKDSGLTVPLSNPFTTDLNGNYPQAALAGGVYTITESASGFAGFSYQATVTCGPGGCTVTTMTANSINNVVHVGGNISSTDIGTQINTAYTNCPTAPSGGCRIIVDPNPTGAEYNFSTPIVMQTLGKFASLECMAPTSTSASAATGGLNYTPTTATTALTMDFGTTGAQNSTSVLRGCHLINNQCFTSGGCGSLATGLKVGNTNAGLGAGGSIVDVTIQGFAVGLDDTNPATFAALNLRNVFLWQNATGWLEGTHDIQVFGGEIAGNATGIKANLSTDNPELYLTDVIFVNQTALDWDGTNVTSGFFNIHANGVHLERAPGRSSHSISGRFFIDFTGGTIEDDNASTDWMITLNNSLLRLWGPHITSNVPSTSFIIANTNVRGVVEGDVSSGNLSTRAAMVSGVSAAQFSILTTVPGAISAPVPWSFESQLQEASGSVSAPSYSFQSSANSGLYFSGNPHIASGGADMVGFGDGIVGVQVPSNSCFSIATAGLGALDVAWCRAAVGVATLGKGNGTRDAFSQSGNTVRLTSNFTTANNTNLQAISNGAGNALVWTMPAAALNWSFACDLSYSQATANAAVAFGIQAATNNPTNIFANGVQQITVGPPATFVTGTLPTLATTTATNIVSGTPGATATNYTVHLAGGLELGASANTINIMVSTAAGADAVTVLRGSMCYFTP